MINKEEYLLNWKKRYYTDLTENIMPFWMEHGLDHEHGGIYTCLDRDGSLMDSTKSVWFQGRFAFICSVLYNKLEKRQEWIDAAYHTINFIENNCFDHNGHMYFSVKADGSPIRKRRYVFSEAFTILAYVEYAIATGEVKWMNRAIAIFHDARHFLETPGLLPPKYESNIKLRSHSETMIFISVAALIRHGIEHFGLQMRHDLSHLEWFMAESIDHIGIHFMHSEFKALLETVGPNGEFIDTNATRVINPGHCMETSWFIMEEARRQNWNPDIVNTALTILDWSWEWGWDKEYGGIINFRDCKHLPSQCYEQDMKFWWPQCEAIIATLYAYFVTHDDIWLERHKMISDWTYDHFPDKEYPEWYGYLHRDGTVAQPAKGNLYKGPFHIPRMMMFCYKLISDQTLPGGPLVL